MKIGIDIDDTICKTSYVTEKIQNKIYNYDFSKLDKISQYEFTVKYEEEIYDYLPLENNAKEVINKLFDEGNEIYFITARCSKFIKNIERRTLDYLDKNKIKYNKIYFGKSKKVDVYEKLKLDVMLDDDYDVYKIITENGHNAIMYNGILNKNKDGIKVNNWEEFKEYIERIKVEYEKQNNNS